MSTNEQYNYLKRLATSQHARAPYPRSPLGPVVRCTADTGGALTREEEKEEGLFKAKAEGGASCTTGPGRPWARRPAPF